MNRFFTLLFTASCLTAVGQYEVGDVGPAGGWIFYVDAENQFEDWDYLEAWPHTFSFFQLLACDYSPYLSSSELGTGENNTMVFTSNDDTFSAFDFAVLFDGGSRNDWFLPSKSELEALNASSVSALINSGEGYSAASSSVFNGCQWWTYDINNGWGIEDDLYSWEWVLPIRSFHTADDGIVCGQGTIWDEELQGCVSANTADINNDGCVQLNDLLDLLTAYGDCGAEESPWQCGDPLEYQGYEYETVQIGEQCWFAENLRAENYRNGDVIETGLSSAQWMSTQSGALELINSSGEVLYNWHVCDDNRGICPSNWSVSSDEDWLQLEMFAGMPLDELSTWGVSRGWADGIGTMFKSFSWNGTDDFDFNVRPIGLYTGYELPYDEGLKALFWSSSPYLGGAGYNLDTGIGREFGTYQEGIERHAKPPYFGSSIRCIKD